MKYFKRKIHIVFIVILLTGYCRANNDGGLPGYFLNQNVGVRALGMGGSYVSLSDDSSSVYWNPAGLNMLKQNEISLMHNILFENTRYDFIGIALPSVNSISVGVGFVQLYSDGGELTDINNNILGSFNDTHNALLLSVGYRLTDNLFIGHTIKYIFESIANNSYSVVSFDTGFLYNFLETIKLGLNIKDILSANLQGTESAIPLSIQVGASWNILNKLLILEVDADYSIKRDLQVHVGAEVSLLNFLSVRGGYTSAGLTAGVGINLDSFIIDYAILNHELGLSHRIGLTYKFGTTK